MSDKNVFRRYEWKYLMTVDQKEKLLKSMEPYMDPDQYGHTSIRNLYYDTDNYRLIRRSVEGSVYKEKLRVRSYGQAAPDSPVFVELKKKYRSVVYKRRIAITEKDAVDLTAGKFHPEPETQIVREIEYFLDYYQTLRPKVFLSYERDAWRAKDGSDFRITFDDCILCREEELSLEAEIWGTPILRNGMILMEIKCSGGIPLWMTNVLTSEHLYKTSFSKYGRAYQTMIFPTLKEGIIHD